MQNIENWCPQLGADIDFLNAQQALSIQQCLEPGSIESDTLQEAVPCAQELMRQFMPLMWLFYAFHCFIKGAKQLQDASADDEELKQVLEPLRQLLVKRLKDTLGAWDTNDSWTSGRHYSEKCFILLDFVQRKLQKIDPETLTVEQRDTMQELQNMTFDIVSGLCNIMDCETLFKKRAYDRPSVQDRVADLLYNLEIACEFLSSVAARGRSFAEFDWQYRLYKLSIEEGMSFAEYWSASAEDKREEPRPIPPPWRVNKIIEFCDGLENAEDIMQFCYQK